MEFIIITTCLILAFILYKRDKNFYSPGVAFCTLFGVILCMNYFGMGDLYRARLSTYCIFALGIFSFVIGDTIGSKIRFKPVAYTRVLNHTKCKISLALIFLILSAQTLLIIYFLQNGGSIGQIYSLMANSSKGDTNELTVSGIYILLTQFIAYPLLYILVPIYTLEFLKTYEKKYIILAVILTTLRVVSDARRTFVVSFIIMLIISFFIYYKPLNQIQNLWERKRVRNTQILLGVITLLALYGFNSVSDSRAEEKDQSYHFYNTLFNYYGGCVYYLECTLDTLKTNFTYGFSSLRGLLAPVCGLLSNIGIEITPYKEASEYVLQLQENTVYITPEKNYNSFATCFYQFYCDLGYAGIAIFSMIYGYVSRYFYKSWKYYKNSLTQARYVFWFACVIMFSFVNFELTNALNALPLLIVFWLYDKKYEVF